MVISAALSWCFGPTVKNTALKQKAVLYKQCTQNTITILTNATKDSESANSPKIENLEEVIKKIEEQVKPKVELEKELSNVKINLDADETVLGEKVILWIFEALTIATGLGTTGLGIASSLGEDDPDYVSIGLAATMTGALASVVGALWYFKNKRDAKREAVNELNTNEKISTKGFLAALKKWQEGINQKDSEIQKKLLNEGAVELGKVELPETVFDKDTAVCRIIEKRLPSSNPMYKSLKEIFASEEETTHKEGEETIYPVPVMTATPQPIKKITPISKLQTGSLEEMQKIDLEAGIRPHKSEDEEMDSAAYRPHHDEGSPENSLSSLKLDKINEFKKFVPWIKTEKICFEKQKLQ